MADELWLTLKGPRDDEKGVLIDDLMAVVKGLQDAMRMMVEHMGGRQPSPGQPPTWVRDQSALRLVATRTGSFVGALALEPPPDGQSYMDNYGSKALYALRNWDGEKGSTLPDPVTDKLFATISTLSDDVRLWIGSADDPRKIEVKRRDRTARSPSETEEALLQGWLSEVNWDKQTAQLHRYEGGYVRLKFGDALYGEMLQLATQYVEIKGSGVFNPKDEWSTVLVEQISGSRSWHQPFDLEAFRNDPNPKLFEPENMVTVSEPFDVDEFIRTIHEGRDV